MRGRPFGIWTKAGQEEKEEGHGLEAALCTARVHTELQSQTDLSSTQAFKIGQWVHSSVHSVSV